MPMPPTAANAYWLEGVDVLGAPDAGLIVALGDSITEGYASTRDTDHTWPAHLSARLAANKATANLSRGQCRHRRQSHSAGWIGGQRAGTFRSRRPESARREVGRCFSKASTISEHANTDPVSADDLIGAYKQVILRAHAHGIKVIGCTLPPYEGAAYYREEGKHCVRRRTISSAPAELSTRSPISKRPRRTRTIPKHIRADFDPGDHLHPNDSGYKAMAESVDLGIFTGKPAKK